MITCVSNYAISPIVYSRIVFGMRQRRETIEVSSPGETEGINVDAVLKEFHPPPTPHTDGTGRGSC